MDLTVFSDIVSQPGERIIEEIGGQTNLSKLSIHSEESIAYYRDTLKANPWVLDVLRNHYKIPFNSIPPPYCEPNNRSAVINKDLLWKKMLGENKIYNVLK